jgi:hypothetical protein
MGFSDHYRNPQLRASRNWKRALGCCRRPSITPGQIGERYPVCATPNTTPAVTNCAAEAMAPKKKAARTSQFQMADSYEFKNSR